MGKVCAGPGETSDARRVSVDGMRGTNVPPLVSLVGAAAAAEVAFGVAELDAATDALAAVGADGVWTEAAVASSTCSSVGWCAVDMTPGSDWPDGKRPFVVKESCR